MIREKKIEVILVNYIRRVFFLWRLRVNLDFDRDIRVGSVL